MAKRRWTSRQTNLLKWQAELLKFDEIVDPETDRIVNDYFAHRKIKYNNVGVTATDKTFAERPANEVVKKIEVRIDRDIEDNQKEYRIKIRDCVYNIERIYVREADRVMEVSLSYAN